MVRNVTTILVIGLSAALGFLITQNAGRAQSAQAAAVNTSGDVSRLPTRVDVAYAPLPANEVVVSADQAVSTAESRFSLPPEAIDEQIGVVRATVTLQGSASDTAAKAWIVTANDPVRSPMTGILYQKMCIAIDVVTGDFLFAYAADPQ